MLRFGYDFISDKKEKLFGTKHEIIDFRCEQNIPSHVEF